VNGILKFPDFSLTLSGLRLEGNLVLFIGPFTTAVSIINNTQKLTEQTSTVTANKSVEIQLILLFMVKFSIAYAHFLKIVLV